MLAGIRGRRFGILDRARRAGRKRWQAIGSFTPFTSALLAVIEADGQLQPPHLASPAAAQLPPPPPRLPPPSLARTPARPQRRSENLISPTKSPPTFGGTVRRWWDRKSAQDRQNSVTLGCLVLGVVVAGTCVSSWWSGLGEKAEEKRRRGVAAQEEDGRRRRAREDADARLAMAAWDGFDAAPIGEQTEARVRAIAEKAKTVSRQIGGGAGESLQRENIDRARKALAAIDARRTAGSRAGEATSLLAAKDGDARKQATCVARRLLSALTPAERRAPDASKALARLRIVEAAILEDERQRVSNSRSLLCRDGSTSPSCSCGRPKRGCCSHHGGVVGCEPMPSLPTEIDCADSNRLADPASW